jgi:hypothetical protein
MRSTHHVHDWDYLTVIWTTAGKRAHPCHGCSELLIYGNVQVKE